MATRLLTDDDQIVETNVNLEIALNKLLADFKAFKITPNLTEEGEIDALGETLCDIGCEIAFLAQDYWSFWRKLRAADRQVIDYINQYLGWLSVEWDAKMSELYEAYPVLDEKLAITKLLTYC